METKYTKGEWEIRGNKIFIKGSNITTATISVQNNFDIIRGKKILDFEQIANAKLIAAAPELLEACIIALKYFNGFDSPEQNEAAFHALNNAIKKATE